MFTILNTYPCRLHKVVISVWMAEFNFLTNLPQILIGIPRESFYTCLSIPLCFFFTIKSFYSLKYSRTGFSASPGFNKTEKYRICGRYDIFNNLPLLFFIVRCWTFSKQTELKTNSNIKRPNLDFSYFVYAWFFTPIHSPFPVHCATRKEIQLATPGRSYSFLNLSWLIHFSFNNSLFSGGCTRYLLRYKHSRPNRGFTYFLFIYFVSFLISFFCFSFFGTMIFLFLFLDFFCFCVYLYTHSILTPNKPLVSLYIYPG